MMSGKIKHTYKQRNEKLTGAALRAVAHVMATHDPSWASHEFGRTLHGELQESLRGGAIRGAALKDWRKDALVAIKSMDDESRELHGQGLMDWFNKAKSVVKETVTRVKSAVRGVRDGYPPSAKQALDRFADWTITSLTVRRDPVQSMINSALNAVSLGNWNKSRAEHGIDKLYHLGLVLGLASPSGEHHDFLAEKNAVINFGFPKAVTGTTQILRVPAPSPPETLGPFMAKAEEMMGKQAFFQYDSFQNNCQDFIRGILNANGVLTPQADTFLKQDLEKVVNSQPKHLGIVANAVTNLGARVDRLVQGGDICGRGMSGGTLAELRAALDRACDHFFHAREQFRVQRSTPGCTKTQLVSAHKKMQAASTHLDNLRLKIIDAAEAAGVEEVDG